MLFDTVQHVYHSRSLLVLLVVRIFAIFLCIFLVLIVFFLLQIEKEKTEFISRLYHQPSGHLRRPLHPLRWDLRPRAHSCRELVGRECTPGHCLPRVWMSLGRPGIPTAFALTDFHPLWVRLLAPSPFHWQTAFQPAKKIIIEYVVIRDSPILRVTHISHSLQLCCIRSRWPYGRAKSGARPICRMDSGILLCCPNFPT